jgi:hypothetical protein
MTIDFLSVPMGVTPGFFFGLAHFATTIAVRLVLTGCCNINSFASNLKGRCHHCLGNARNAARKRQWEKSDQQFFHCVSLPVSQPHCNGLALREGVA